MAFLPLLSAAPAIADETNGVTVVVTTDEQITTTTITLKQAGDDLQVVTKELADSVAMANTLSPVASVTDAITLATTEVNQAVSDLLLAQTALVSAQDAAAALVAAQAAYDLASTNLATSASDLAAAKAALIKANSDVAAQQVIVNSEQAKLNTLKSTPTGGYTYTTSGYVAPTPSPTPVSTTVRLPSMWDASTKIDVPFDIKLGGITYEGQGSDSQIYVTSKAFMSFGSPDFTFWDWPQTQGIYVYQSDWMSAGNGAYIDVTTTDTTLKIEWSLHPFGNEGAALTNVVWNMTVNPTTGEWTGYSTISGNTNVQTGGPRIGVRETSGGAINNMTSVPSDPALVQQIADQTVIVNGVNATLQSLITTKNAVVLAVNNKQVVYDSANAIATSTSVARNKAILDLAYAIDTSKTLAEAVVISVTDAETQVEKTYIVVSAEKAIQSYVPPAPQPEPIVDPEPEPTVEPQPEPEPTIDPAPEPEILPEPEIIPEPEVIIEPEPEQVLEKLLNINPEELTDAQVEELVAAAEKTLATADENSPEYAAALDALAVAAQADDPELPAELAAIPGAAAVLEAFNALGNMGADMSPAARAEAEKIIVAGVVAVNAALGAIAVPSAPSAPSGGTSSSGSGSPSARRKE